MSDVVQKLWGFCHTLRHDGVDYGDYIEQLTYLLFLKMTGEREIDLTKIPWQDEKGKHTTDCSWGYLTSKAGTPLSDHYAEVLRVLSRQPGLLGEIFTQATSRFNNPVNLKKLIQMIDDEDWSAMDVDVKGAAFEGLLEKAASEGKKGAGQYFTPRRLIESICCVMKPDPRAHKEFRIMDPACGTGVAASTSRARAATSGDCTRVEVIEEAEWPQESIPDSWAWVRFGSVIGELRNGVSPRPNIDPPGTPVLRISAARPGSVDFLDARYLTNGADFMPTFALRDDDLLFTRYNGSIELLGVCGMVRGLGKRTLLYPDKLMRVCAPIAPHQSRGVRSSSVVVLVAG